MSRKASYVRMDLKLALRVWIWNTHDLLLLLSTFPSEETEVYGPKCYNLHVAILTVRFFKPRGEFKGDADWCGAQLGTRLQRKLGPLDRLDILTDRVDCEHTATL